MLACIDVLRYLLYARSVPGLFSGGDVDNSLYGSLASVAYHTKGFKRMYCSAKIVPRVSKAVKKFGRVRYAIVCFGRFLTVKINKYKIKSPKKHGSASYLYIVLKNRISIWNG